MATERNNHSRWMLTQLAAAGARQMSLVPAELALLAGGEESRHRGWWEAGLEAAPSAAGRVLRWAESPASSVYRPAPPGLSPLASALERLGPGGVRRLLLADLVDRLYPVGPETVGLILGLRRHALVVAAAAAAVGWRAEGAPPAEMFVAGLLHDVGEAALLQHAGPAWVVAKAEGVAEERLGFGHADVGAEILGAAGAPAFLVALTRDHTRVAQVLSTLPRGRHRQRLACLWVAETVAESLGWGEEDHLPQVSRAQVPAEVRACPGWAVLGLDPRRAEHVVDGAEVAARAVLKRYLWPVEDVRAGERVETGVPEELRAVWGGDGRWWKETEPNLWGRLLARAA